MTHVTHWLTIVLLAEFTLAAFLIFALPHLAWWKRAFSALFGLGCLIVVVTMSYVAIAGQGPFMEDDPKMIGIAFVFIGLLGFKLYLILRDYPLSCGGTLLRMAGCVIVGILLAAGLVFGLGAMIGLSGYLSH